MGVPLPLLQEPGNLIVQHIEDPSIYHVLRPLFLAQAAHTTQLNGECREKVQMCIAFLLCNLSVAWFPFISEPRF